VCNELPGGRRPDTSRAGRVDVVVNNAGMLMIGMTEAFAPEQVAQIFDTNAISCLRVNRAALPAMRRRGRGVLVYISSKTAHIFEPFMGPYVASNAAGEASVLVT
jgi:NAD(P)-dependent dehydrogenase (short-subunit alcohol dehydrogenase family)